MVIISLCISRKEGFRVGRDSSHWGKWKLEGSRNLKEIFSQPNALPLLVVVVMSE